MSDIIAVARTRWPEIPDDVKIIRVPPSVKTMTFPILKLDDVGWQRYIRADWSAELDAQCVQFEKATIRLEPIGERWMGFDSEINTLCIGEKGNRE